jgi:hypothetical protein
MLEACAMHNGFAECAAQMIAWPSCAPHFLEEQRTDDRAGTTGPLVLVAGDPMIGKCPLRASKP